MTSLSSRFCGRSGPVPSHSCMGQPLQWRSASQAVHARGSIQHLRAVEVFSQQRESPVTEESSYRGPSVQQASAEHVGNHVDKPVDTAANSETQPSSSSSSNSSNSDKSQLSSTDGIDKDVDAAKAGSSNNAAEDVDKQLSAVWEDLKRQMKADMDPESARVLDSISYEELTGSNAQQFFRKLANAQLGPILSSLGLNVDPFDFFVEVVKLATFLQFITCGLTWYGSSGLAHLDAPSTITATVGLALGYLTRPAFKIEQLLYPVYNAVLQLFTPQAEYMVAASTRAEVQGTLNKLGITLALLFLVPQLLWHWETARSTALVVPWCSGWFLFDLTYMGAMLLVLNRQGDPPE